jgi:acetylornithine/N-succinyldiaminopimelate aminotransferase
MQINNIMNTYNRKPIIFNKGEGIWLFDKNGKRYMDFVSGVAVNCLGHSHPAMVEGLQKQVENLMHVSNLYWTDEQIGLGKTLCSMSGLSSAFFCNSGAESLETAFKIARKYGLSKADCKSKIIVMQNAFHGRTMGALSLTWNEKYKKPFGSLISEVVQVPLNDKCALSDTIDDKVCAIVIEPIQGEGGIYNADTEYLQYAKDLANEYDALLIFDEVQCGIGRTGNMFAFQDSGVKPDVLCLAKGLGGGMPIGAVVVSERADILTPGDHGSTFGGNPLACTAGNIVLGIVGDDSFLDNVKAASDYLIQGLNALHTKNAYLVEVRGSGLMLGVETTFKSTDVIEEALKHNLLLIGAGENTVRIIPPLIISMKEIDVFLEKVDKIICNLLNQ